MPHNHYNYPPYNHTKKREAWIVLVMCVAFVAVLMVTLAFFYRWLAA